MHWITTKRLVVVGLIATLVGAVTTMTFAIMMSSNDVASSLVAVDGTVSGGAKLSDPSLPVNTGDLWGAWIGFVVLSIGAVCMVAAAILSMPRFNRKLVPQT